MKLSPQGLHFLARHEGIVPAPYLDSVGVWTYGIGHAETSGIAPNPRHMRRGMPEDLDAELVRVFDVFRKDMAKFEAGVNAAVKVPMRQHEFDAAVSFHFNTGGIARATWVKTWNAGDKAKAAKQIMNWRKPPEIIGRRTAEQTLWAQGDYGSGKAHVWRVSASNKPVYRGPLRSLTQQDVMRLLRAEAPKPDPTPAPTPSKPPAARKTGFLAFLLSLLWRK
ncbi:MAG: lysozyme [Pseudomonadota bacterium]